MTITKAVTLMARQEYPGMTTKTPSYVVASVNLKLYCFYH